MARNVFNTGDFQSSSSEKPRPRPHVYSMSMITKTDPGSEQGPIYNHEPEARAINRDVLLVIYLMFAHRYADMYHLFSLTPVHLRARESAFYVFC